MKVILLNGSPHVNGTTKRALTEVANTLNKNGIETEFIEIGSKAFRGCMACGGCVNAKGCVIDDGLNEIVDKIKNSDGLVVGSPVYYASLSGTLKCFLDRAFYSKESFAGKPACAVAVARRAGTTATLDIINKYFMISNMPVVSSQYWNMVHGSNSNDAESDFEGLQTMRILGENMAWLIKCIEEGKKKGINLPDYEKHVKTNFIR